MFNLSFASRFLPFAATDGEYYYGILNRPDDLDGFPWKENVSLNTDKDFNPMLVKYKLK